MTDEQLKQIEDLAIKLKELNELDAVEALLKNNVNEFIYNDLHYRVHKPNPMEKEIANKERMKKYFEMVKDPAYMFKKDLMKIYETRGINIDAMELKIKNLYCKEQGIMSRLAQTQDPADIKLYKDEIEKLRYEQAELHYQIDDLLKFCIEQQMEDFVRCYLLYLVIETRINNVWEKTYESYEAFMASKDELLQAKAAQVFAVMLSYEKL